MKTTVFTVIGEPQGKARPRILRSGRTYTPKKTADYEKAIRAAFKGAGGELTEYPVRVSITAYYRIPQSASKRMQAQMMENAVLPMKKPDLDNLAKAVCDALNGIAYKDDAQVCELFVQKLYSREPMTVVTVRELIL